MLKEVAFYSDVMASFLSISARQRIQFFLLWTAALVKPPQPHVILVYYSKQGISKAAIINDKSESKPRPYP